jgi:DNA-binding transcriptional regulator YdaS (Cro superfamily)
MSTMTPPPPTQISLSEIFTLAGGVTKLALGVGVNRTTVYRWQDAFGGIGQVPQDHVLAVAKLIGVHPERIRPDLAALIADWIAVADPGNSPEETNDGG